MSEATIKVEDFKRQVGKPLGVEMRKLGFKGSGFIYKKEDEDFLYAVYLQGGRWGGKYCTVGFAVHPKQIKKHGDEKLDLNKLPIHFYEFRMGTSKSARGQRWDYSDHVTENLKLLDKIVSAIKSKVIPVIKLYAQKPGLLDTFGITEIKQFHRNYTQKTGTSIATTDIRFAWAIATIFESKNPAKAKRFAAYGLSKCTTNDTFFGKADFERILNKQ